MAKDPRKDFTKVRAVLVHALVELQDGRCPECHASAYLGDPLELDHITPLSEGGEWELGNMQAIHRGCHIAKSGRESGARNRRRAAARRAARGGV